MRGLSGLAIDAANRHGQAHGGHPMAHGLARANTFYYPTAATLRQAYATRRTNSEHKSQDVY